MTATKNTGVLAALLVLLACGAACQRSSQSVTPSPAQPQQATQPVAEPERKAAPQPQANDAGNPVEGCVDAWLAQRKLDPYGNAEGTMYAGGTPLFNEQTGETTDRIAYVFAKHPDAKAACRADAGADSGAKPGGLPTR